MSIVKHGWNFVLFAFLIYLANKTFMGKVNPEGYFSLS